MKHLFLYIIFQLTLGISISFAGDGIRFVENKGQWPQQVQFKSDVQGGSIWLENNKISYQFTKYPALHANFKSKEKAIVRQHVVWAEFIGSNKNYDIIKKEKSKDYYNYYIGNDRSKWASGVYAFSDIDYANFYNNIDLRVYENEGHLKYDFILKPGSSNEIQINYRGQDNIKINKKGELVIYTSLGQIIEEKPYAYQIQNGIEKKVACQFVLKNGIVTFKLGGYDHTLDLIIDPTLIFASYNGSPSDNFGMTATYDENGNLYTGGTVFGANYPTTPGAYNPTGSFPNTISSAANSPVYGVTDVFISKYEPNGTSLIYSTYLGGGNVNGGTEAVHSLICDSIGNLHMFGTTSSTDFPTTVNAYQDSLKAGSLQQFQFNAVTFISNGAIDGTDIFVAKFDSTGSNLLGSTFIGGSRNDGLNYNISSGTYNSALAYDSLTSNYGDQFRGEIMIDRFGYIYFTSSTYSNDFPIINGFQNTNGGQQDAVICKFSPNLDSLIWSSYLGGADKDAGYSIKLNANQDVIVAGGTASSNFPTTLGTINPALQGDIDGYLTKIDRTGGSILSSTFIGTNSYDQCYFIEIDRFGTIYTVGQTKGNFPIINSPYSNPNSGAFIMRVDSNLANIDYSTVFGNGNVNAQFSPSAFLVDRCQNVYVSGWGGSVIGGSPLTNMPITTNSIQSAAGDIISTTSGDGFNFYLTVFERDMQSQLFGIYYGGGSSGEHVDGGTSRFDKNGIIYQSVCAGCGNNNDFPTTTGVVSNINQSSNCNNGVFKFDFEIIPKAQFTVDNFQGCSPLTVTFTNTSNASDTYLWDFGGGDTTSQIFNPIKTYTTPGVYFVSLLITDSICNTVDTAFQTITVDSPVTLSVLNNSITTCDTTTLYASASSNTNNIIWSTNNQFTDTLNPSLFDSTIFVNGTGTITYYVMASNGVCADIDSIVVDFNPVPTSSFFADTLQGCAPLTVNFTNTSSPSDGYLWDFGNGDTTSLILNPVRTYNTPGNYLVTLSISDSICNIRDTTTITIIVAPQVTVTASGTATICDTTTISASSTGGVTNFIWSSNNQFTDTLNPNLTDSTLFVTVSDTNTFYIMVSNGICSAIDSVLINYVGVRIIAHDSATCLGNQINLLVTNLTNQTLSYSWTPTSSIISGANTASPTVNPDSSTAYIVTVQNTFGCTATDTAMVVASGFNPNDINLWADKDTLYSGEGTLLHVTPISGFSHLWIPAISLDNPTSPNPFANPTTTTTYAVQLTENSSGCQNLKFITIYAFEVNCGEPDIFLPNAFTPNDDKENDILFVRGRNVEEMVLKIYDRWGELVFETDKKSVGWDGTYKGDLVEPGVFVYYLTVTCVDEQEYFKKGNVTVIR
jgi:gliding motility-associated-like protein